MGNSADIRNLLQDGLKVREIARELDIPLTQVMDVACSTERLEHLYHDEDLTQREIAEQVGVSQACISRRVKETGIETGYRAWKREEEQVLADRYGSASRTELESLFPERSWNAITLKAMELGVATPATEHRNSEETARHLRLLAEDNLVEIDFHRYRPLAYILGVIDGDGFHNRRDTVGLEVNSSAFADKFAAALEDIGIDAGQGRRRKRDRETVWGCSRQFVAWLMEFSPGAKHDWLLQHEVGWDYIEGLYESDGNLTYNGTARICSYDAEAKEFIATVLRELGIDCSIQQNNVYVFKQDAETFFNNIDPVHRAPG